MATGYTSSAGKSYILIFNEALYMPTLDHSLINPNQLRHYQTTVQDNPYHEKGMHIVSPNEEITMCLESAGTTIFFDSWTPTLDDLESLPHVVLSSPHPWNPATVTFPKLSYSMKEELEQRSISDVIVFPNTIEATMQQYDDFEPKDAIGVGGDSTFNLRTVKALLTSPLSQHERMRCRTQPPIHRHNLVQSICLKVKWPLQNHSYQRTGILMHQQKISASVGTSV